MKYIYLFLALFLFSGCSDTPEEMDFNSNNTLKASVEKNTRVGFDNAGAFYWSQGDQLGVATTQGTTFTTFNITSGAGTGAAEFKGEISGQMGGYAIYPASAAHSLSNTTLTYNLPATYAYTTLDADFFTPTKGEGCSFNAPMWGAISNGSTTMKHLGGVFCVKVTDLPVGENMKMEFSSNQQLNGNFEVDLSQATPVINAVASATAGDNKVSITFSNSVENGSGVFYIPVGVGAYEDIYVKILSATDEVLKNNAIGTKSINRCDLRQIGASAELFPDPVFKKYVMDNFDYNKDGQLSQEEMDAVTMIKVDNYSTYSGIKSIQGIELFNNLTYFGMWYQDVSSLDFSKNTKLKEIGVNNNQKLTSLEVSKNTALTYLHCGYTQITSLNTSNQNNLETLYCMDTQITSLDVSKNTELKYLDCSTTSITYLNISGCKKLTNIEIRNCPNLGDVCVWEGFSESQISTLDKSDSPNVRFVVKNELFPDPIFKKYVMDTFDTSKDGKLSQKELEVVTDIYVDSSTYSGIKSVEGVGLFKNLENFTMLSQDVTSIDFGQNTKLKEVNVENNSMLTTLDVSKNIMLTNLDCSVTSITTLDLGNNTALYHLDCGSTQISTLDLRNNTSLYHLDCSSTQISNLDLGNNTALNHLNCSFTQISTLDLRNNTSLYHLDCSSTRISNLDVHNNPFLYHLHCSSTSITSLDLRNNTLIMNLTCSSTQISNLDLSNITSLTDLDCSSTPITTLDISGCRNLLTLFMDSCPQLGNVYVWEGFDESRFTLFDKSGSPNVNWVVKQ